MLLLKHPRAMLHRAAFGIGSGIIELGDAGVGYGPGTHRARLQCDPQLAAIKPLIAKYRRRRAYRQHFGMGSGIVQGARGVVGSGDDRAVFDHHRANRHLSGRHSFRRFAKREHHRFGKWPAGHSAAMP